VNLLIIGGLLVVAAAAIIGAVLIGMSEQRTQRSRNASLKQPTSTATSDLATHKLIEEPTTTTSRPNLPTTRESNLPSRGEDQRLSSLNGQFHELASEVRTLHQQASQLEQRLSILTEMVDHIERTQGGHFSIEEETSPTSDNTLA
jgi:hypothetical protein